MGLLIGVVGLVFFILLIRWMVKGMNPPSQTDLAKTSARKVALKQETKTPKGVSPRPERLKNYTLPPIPEGHQIYLKRAYVAGVQFYEDNVWDLAASERPSLSWARDRTNPHDENAIQIFYGRGQDRELIGHVDRDLAASLAELNNFDDLDIRFAGAEVHANWKEVYYQVIGPKGGKEDFEALLD